MSAQAGLVGKLRNIVRPAVHSYYRWKSAPRTSEISYGLDRLDRTLEKWLDFDGGVFIEAGANDGVSVSNTLYFERHRRWTGLLIEPIPELASQCVHNRSSSTGVALCALGGPEDEGKLVPLTYCNLMSIVKGAIGSETEDAAYVELGQNAQSGLAISEPYETYAAVFTLSSLIDRFGLFRIDLLVLDVEGYERQALAGLDMERHRPRFILVEALFHEEEIRTTLAAHYDFVAELGRKDLLFHSKIDKGPAP